MHQQVEFWYSVDSDAEAGFPANLAELCRRAGVTLHTVISERDERLRADEVAAVLGNLADGSVWFCGPDGFGEDIKRGLRKKGLSRRDFHSERFDFR